jgi:hypothetical protein
MMAGEEIERRGDAVPLGAEGESREAKLSGKWTPTGQGSEHAAVS